MKNRKQLIYGFLGIILINIIGSYFYKRFDLTQDQRYSLSNAAKETIATINIPIFIDVFLEGDLPSEFKRLQVETKQILEEFEAYNPITAGIHLGKRNSAGIRDDESLLCPTPPERDIGQVPINQQMFMGRP